jgi:hypothetical protein
LAKHEVAGEAVLPNSFFLTQLSFTEKAAHEAVLKQTVVELYQTGP